jgi:hypothetical protein
MSNAIPRWLFLELNLFGMAFAQIEGFMTCCDACAWSHDSLRL